MSLHEWSWDCLRIISFLTILNIEIMNLSFFWLTFWLQMFCILTSPNSIEYIEYFYIMSYIIFVYICICRIDIYIWVYCLCIYIYKYPCFGYSLVVESVSNSGFLFLFSGTSLAQFLLDMCGWWIVAPCVLRMFSLSDKIGMWFVLQQKSLSSRNWGSLC